MAIFREFSTQNDYHATFPKFQHFFYEYLSPEYVRMTKLFFVFFLSTYIPMIVVSYKMSSKVCMVWVSNLCDHIYFSIRILSAMSV